MISSGCLYIFTSPLHPWIRTGHRDGESHRLAQNSSQVSEKFACNRLRPRRRLRRGLAGCPLDAPAPSPTAGTPPVSPRRSGLGRAVAMVTQGDAAPHVPSVRPERGGRAGPVRWGERPSATGAPVPAAGQSPGGAAAPPARPRCPWRPCRLQAGWFAQGLSSPGASRAALGGGSVQNAVVGGGRCCSALLPDTRTAPKWQDLSPNSGQMTGMEASEGWYSAQQGQVKANTQPKVGLGFPRWHTRF